MLDPTTLRALVAVLMGTTALFCLLWVYTLDKSDDLRRAAARAARVEGYRLGVLHGYLDGYQAGFASPSSGERARSALRSRPRTDA